MKKIKMMLTAIVISFLFTGVAHATLLDGLAGYYPFNGNANDTSGNGNDGTVYGATLTTDRFGNANSAYNFNEMNDNYIELTNEFNFDFQRTDSFSLGAWINSNEDEIGDGIIVSKQVSGITGWILVLNSSGAIDMFFINALNSNMLQVKSTDTINRNEWHHVAMTYDGSSSPSGVKIYIDGTESSLVTISDTLTSSILTDIDVAIGGRQSGNSDDAFFDGYIDEVRIYNRTLSYSEIQQLSAVPEPTSLLLVGSGLVGMIGLKRKFRK